jgi:outer membrane protein TolC
MRIFLAVVVAAVLAAGCASEYERSADREVEPLLAEYQAKVDKERSPETPAGVITPKPEGPEMTPEVATQAAAAPEMINLQQTLALKFSTSRDFRSRKESLYLSMLSFTLTRHNFEWRPSASISGDITAVSSPTSATGDATVRLARTLLSGGQFSLSSTAKQNGTTGGTGTDSNSSTTSMSFSQPLLAGAGTAAREQWVQAQRSLLYDARDFEVFRQQLVIDTVSQYYGLLAQRRFLETGKTNVDNLTFLYEKSKALFDKGMGSLLDVFRAEQAKLSGENSYNDQREAYNLALDKFKLTLGYPTGANIDVAEEPIEPEIISVSLEAAVKTALANRLDLLTARQGLEDTERGVEIARNALLPQLDFTANASAGSRSNWLDYSLADTGSASAGLSLELPIDKKPERNAYKGSLISLARARRSYDLAEDNVTLNVRETVRNLRQAEVSLAIQKKRVELAQKQLEAAQIFFEKGEYSNREVVDAQSAVQDSMNAYVQAKVDYLIASITLKKDIGTLRVEENGRWH